jgi:hypothetical protein
MILLSHAFSKALGTPQDTFSDGEPLTFAEAQRTTRQRRACAFETPFRAEATSARNALVQSGQEQSSEKDNCKKKTSRVQGEARVLGVRGEAPG